MIQSSSMYEHDHTPRPTGFDGLCYWLGEAVGWVMTGFVAVFWIAAFVVVVGLATWIVGC